MGGLEASGPATFPRTIPHIIPRNFISQDHGERPSAMVRSASTFCVAAGEGISLIFRLNDAWAAKTTGKCAAYRNPPPLRNLFAHIIAIGILYFKDSPTSLLNREIM